MSSHLSNNIRISAPGSILPGTVSTAMSKCGKPNCKCKASPPLLHGPYYRWTGLMDGKPTTRTISKNIAQECERRIKKYRVLQGKIKKVIDASLANAPWLNK